MKKFFGWLLLAVVVGLAARYFMNKWPFDGASKKPAKPKPPEVIEPPSVEDTTPDPVAEPTEPDPVREADETPKPPEPPRLAGSTLITDDGPRHFAPAPGVIYHCRGRDVIAQPKDGSEPSVVGECDGAFDFKADAHGVHYCDDNTLQRITAGTEGNKTVADADCILMALDGKYAYFVVPGFEGVENPGVYRVERAGGTPERIHATRPKEQFGIHVDNEAIWISAWAAGTISKLEKKPGAKARTLVSGQKGIVSFGVDAKWLYWYSEGTSEVRRRAKTGGPIEVIGKDVDQEPVLVVDGHAYWFEGGPGAPKKLMHLAPDEQQAVVLVGDLRMPSMEADSEGVYVTELDRDGLFWFKR